jgi:hypothetical protein
MPSPIPKLAPRKQREPLSRSQMMARIRSKNTRPELLTRARKQAALAKDVDHQNDFAGLNAATTRVENEKNELRK